MRVEYALKVEIDDTLVRGSFASGDDASDKEDEDRILARLDVGDVWAWAYVVVEARATIRGRTFVGSDGLGGCSYASEEDFRRPGGCFDDMKRAALADLKAEIARACEACNGTGVSP